MIPMLILIGAQLVFNISDLMGRYNMSRSGFHLTSFLTTWFVVYMTIRVVATMAQLYVFTNFELGKTITLAGVMGLILANILGVLLLKEQLSVTAYIGIAFAVIAFILVGFAHSH